MMGGNEDNRLLKNVAQAARPCFPTRNMSRRAAYATFFNSLLAAGGWSCVSKQRTGGERRAAHGVNGKVSAIGLTPPGSP